MWPRSMVNSGEVSFPSGASPPRNELTSPFPWWPVTLFGGVTFATAGRAPNAAPSTFQSP
jgi:hypothetical protein